MYFGVERQRTADGQLISNTTYAVNNVYVNGIRVAAITPSGEARYYLTDQVDSVKVVLDDEGNAITRFEYLPYGEEWITETREGIEEQHNPKFNGQELDKETGYYYYNARYYDPGISRFTTADNVVDGEYSTQGWNRYMYCHGNPVVYKDPTGHIIETAWDIASLAMSAGELADAVQNGSKTDVAIAAASCAVDLAAVLLPGVPGGAGAAVKATKAAGKKIAKEITEQAVKKGAKEGAEKVAKEGIEKIPLKNNSARKLLKSRGLTKKESKEVVSSFDGQIFASKGKKGDEFIVTESREGSASGVFVTRESAGSTPLERIRNLALPPSNTAKVESKVKLSRDQLLLEGKVAPQPKWGDDRIGGAWQTVTDGGFKNKAIER